MSLNFNCEDDLRAKLLEALGKIGSITNTKDIHGSAEHGVDIRPQGRTLEI